MPCRRCRVPRPASQKAERVTFHRGDGTLHMGSIRGKAHPLPKPKRHMATVSTPVGRWMKVQGRFKMQVLTPYCAHTRQYTVDSAGRWRKYLGTGRKCAHPRSLIRVHVGVGQCCRAVDGEPPALQANKAERVTFHRGDGGNAVEGSK